MKSPFVTRRRLRWLIAVSVLVVAAWAAVTFTVAWTLTRRGGPRRPEPTFEVANIVRQDLTLTTEDGETLGAWLFPGRTDVPVALVMHGNNASRHQCRGTIELLTDRGCTVLAVTLRAHGDSTGTVNDIGWSARRDVAAAVTFLRSQFPKQPIAVFGRSMSSAAAIFAAGSLGDDVDGYWLEQPYNSLETAVWRRLQMQLPRGCDWAAFLGMRMWSGLLLPVSLMEIAPAKQIAAIPTRCPLVVLSGDADHHLPLEDVNDVIAPVRDRAKLIVVPSAGHVTLSEAFSESYATELDAFLKRVASPR